MPEDQVPPFPPGMLTEGAGYTWRRLGGYGGPRTLHLVPTYARLKVKAACGRPAVGIRLGNQETDAVCQVCQGRNGGEV